MKSRFDFITKSIRILLILIGLAVILFSLLIVDRLTELSPGITGFIIFAALIFSILIFSVYFLLRLRAALNTIRPRIHSSERVSSSVVGILHELSQINVILLFSAQIKSHIDNKPKLLEYINSQEKLLETYSSKIQTLKQSISDSFDSSFRTMNVTELLDQVIIFANLKHFLDEKIKIVRDYSDPFYIYISPAEIHSAILNIIENSYDSLLSAKKKDGEIRISAEKNNENISITIEDNGPGFPRKHGNIPLNYFKVGETTKTKGSGIGMIYAIEVIKRNHGDLRIYSTPAGCKTTITFPPGDVKI